MYGHMNVKKTNSCCNKEYISEEWYIKIYRHVLVTAWVNLWKSLAVTVNLIGPIFDVFDIILFRVNIKFIRVRLVIVFSSDEPKTEVNFLKKNLKFNSKPWILPCFL